MRAGETMREERHHNKMKIRSGSRYSPYTAMHATSGSGKPQNVGIEYSTDYNGAVKARNNLFYYFRGGAGE